jgi:DNA-binding LacI/PurR family transcriptional regulator/signal transduction histidine kinase/ActR/RegA family two-component response regulator
MHADGSSDEAIRPAEKPSRVRPSRPRKRIVVLIDYIDHVSGGYEPQLRAGVDASCRARGFELLIVVGRPFDHPDPVSRIHNGIYELLDEYSADGVIFLSASLAAYTGPERIAAFRERLGSVPVCSVGAEVPGIPSIVVDNRPGMAALIEHLIGVHGKRRIAFIGGAPRNADAEARFAVYREVLARNDIAFDPRLVTSGFFHAPSGAKAALELLDRCVPFDALVVANDGMALSAVEAIKSRGMRVPRDLVVTGFDDLVLARIASPPLTTVRQPLERMGALAVDLIAEQMLGNPVPARIELPVEFVPRESCGCTAGISPLRRNSEAPAVSRRPLPREVLAQRVAAAAQEVHGPNTPWIARLVEALEVEIEGTPGEFLAALSDPLEEVGDAHAGFEKLQRAVGALRQLLGRPDLEAVWQSAERAIESAMARAQARQKLATDVVFQNLLRSGERFMQASLGWPALARVIGEELNEQRIRNACISLYEGANRTTLKPFVRLREGERDAYGDERFDAGSLIPVPASDRRRTWFALPLTFEAEELGVAAFELGTGMVVHEMLRGQISAAIHGAALHHEIVRTTALHERSVQERIATSNRMEALSVLAGGVAHDLNNALGPLVTLPDVILAEIDELKRGVLTDDRELRLDVITIKSSALRAAQTIKDLMMLGRPGATSKQTVDLNEIVAGCMAAEPLRFVGQRRSAQPVRIELAPERLPIAASEPHLARVLSNLVRNAAEASGEQGEIVVSTQRSEVASPLGGHESVPPGDYAVLTVSDSGHGIAPDALRRIFEPFFSTKRLADHSGSGLGLAIVHGVVKEHGGFIDVESELGGGTTFRLYFPRVCDALERISLTPQAPRGSARILVVDDEPSQLHLAERVLRHLGYVVDTLESGNQALELYARARGARRQVRGAIAAVKPPYDLVILDFKLHEARTGLETLRRIRRLYPKQRGIMVSGQEPSNEDRRDLGAHIAWLAKPYSADVLAVAVKQALDANTL